jgi:uncharacterized protein YrrD
MDEELTETLGLLGGILIHPDTGSVEGFFVRAPRLIRSEELFLSSFDILRWGLRIIVRDGSVLSPLAERIRLQSLVEEGRSILGQPIVTESGRALGRCGDVQFDTRRFSVEWIWPRRFWKWRTPLPLSSIVEVRRDAIVVRDPETPASEKKEKEELEAPMLKVPETA